MKSSSILKMSFTTYSDLLKNQWQQYAWYLLCRVAELLLLGGLVALLVSTGIFSPESIGFLIILFFLAVFVGAFLLEAWFIFCLYRSLDDNSKDRSLGEFLTRGMTNYWSTVGKYVLLGLMWMALLFVGGGIGSLFEGSAIAGIYGLAFAGVVAYIGLSFLLTMYEVVIHSLWPWTTLKKMRLHLKGKWWRMFGTLIVWALISLLVFVVIGGIFGVLFFSNMGEFLSGLQSSSSVNPQETMAQLAELFSGGMLFTVLSGLIVFIAASIVPVYGFFSVYKAVKKA